MKMKTILATGVAAAMLTTPALADITIAHVYGKTGALEAYAAQSHNGLMLGLEYATGGTMEINGEKLVVIEKDTQLKPDIGKALLAEAYGDDEADIAVGPVSSGVALAMLPVAQEYEKILIVEPAVADSITGQNWNRYIFRTGRNSSQDAISNAVALGGEGVTIATLAQDYAFGRDGVAAFREALNASGAKIAHEEYVPTDTTDFTAAAERIFNAMEGVEGKKKLFIIWAGGGNPMGKINAMDPSRFGIEIATGGNILAALKAYKELPGMEGATYYYYEIPQNRSTTGW
jgi:branched-chain amino acid transport system substrate-binding protein